MISKDDFILEAFNNAISRYPGCCRSEITIPNSKTFDIDYVDPQADPKDLRSYDEDLYNRLHSHIIDQTLNRFSPRRKKRLEDSMWSMFKEMDDQAAISLITKYLMLSGRRHQISDWSWLGGERWRQKLRHRMKNLREDLIPVIRTSLGNLAFADQDIPTDVLVFMRMMLGE